MKPLEKAPNVDCECMVKLANKFMGMDDCDDKKGSLHHMWRDSGSIQHQ